MMELEFWFVRCLIMSIIACYILGSCLNHNTHKKKKRKKVIKKKLRMSVLLRALNSRLIRPLTFTKASTQVEEYVKCIQSISNPPVINYEVMKTMTEREQFLVVLMHSLQMEMPYVIPEPEQEAEEAERCSICHDDVRCATSNYMARLFKCTHAPFFHPHCLSKHIMYQQCRGLSALCPLCNAPLIS